METTLSGRRVRYGCHWRQEVRILACGGAETVLAWYTTQAASITQYRVIVGRCEDGGGWWAAVEVKTSSGWRGVHTDAIPDGWGLAKFVRPLRERPWKYDPNW